MDELAQPEEIINAKPRLGGSRRKRRLDWGDVGWKETHAIRGGG